MSWMIPRSRAGMVWRMVAAAVLVIGATAATTAVAGLLQVNTLVGDISVGNGGLKVKQLVLPQPGQPQTILLIGSDHRAGEGSFKNSNTDTILLVRLNANSSTINVMSIPRDLQVQVPGYSIAKINAAYSDGGYGLLIRTIKQNVFPDLHVNHIVDTNFSGFSDLVDAIGCVYSDVDHRYYNVSAPGPNDYSSIDIEPGYQKLCGDNQAVTGALPFVRFRHTDTDLVREARQQDFIRWAKDQYSTQQLLNNRNRLLKIFGKHSTTDKGLHTTDGLLNLFTLVLYGEGATIKQIPFPASLQPCTATSCFVTAEQSQEQQVYNEFMKATPRPKAGTAKTKVTVPKSLKGHKKQAGYSTAGLTLATSDGHSQAAQLSKVGMPVYFPKYIASDLTYCLALLGNCNDGSEPATAYEHSYPREYLVRGKHGVAYHAYRMTLQVANSYGEYVGVQGIQWRNPPLLKSPSGTRTINGRKLFLYANGGKLTTVAWHQGPNTYWISNTLTSDIPNGELVSMAASMIRARL